MTDYAIIGDGAAGTTAAFYIRRQDPKAKIRIYSDDPSASYYRAALTNYMMGELRAEQLFAVTPNFFDRFKVDRIAARVTSVDTAEQRLELNDGRKPGYDRLLVASGARANMPPIDGVELAGVMTMRTMQDARLVMDMIGDKRLKSAAIVGGGILGLEWVAALTTRKVKAYWLIRGDTVVSPPLDKTASDLLVARCRHFGVQVLLDEELAGVEGNGQLARINLANAKESVDVQLLGFSIGIAPNVAFLEGSGVETNRGVIVDDQLQSNIEGVFAAGDVAEVKDPFAGNTRVIGLWEPARYHGRVAGMNMAGGSESWNMEVGYTATRLYDMDLAAVGVTQEEPTDETVVDFPKEGSAISYRKLVIRDGKLAGALLMGQRKQKVRERGRQLRKLVALGADVSEVSDDLLDPFFDVAAYVKSLQPAEESGPRATIVGPAMRPRMSTMMGAVAVPETPAAGRATLAGLMTGVQGLSGGLAPPAAERPDVKAPKPSGAASLRFDDGHLRSLNGKLVIGRDPEVDLVLEDDQISRRHAEIDRQGSFYVIDDLGSQNGTAVNGTSIESPVTLRHGDEITVGGMSLTFIQQVMSARATTGPAGLPDEALESHKPSEKLLGRLEWGSSNFEIRQNETSLGRNDTCDVVVADSAVSGLHAQISRQGDSLFLRDLGSRNGTFVNSQLVSVPHSLATGDVIHVGNTDLTVHTEGALRPAAVAEVAGETKPEGPRLLVRSGSLLGMTLALKSPTVIGRDPAADITVKDMSASRSHARIELKGTGWVITDLASSNGTLVGAEQLAPNKPKELATGDVIEIGDETFVFDGASEEPSARDEERLQAKTMVAPRVTGGRGTVRVEFSLQFGRGPRKGQKLPLPRFPVTLGREADGEIIGTDDKFVSGAHAQIDRLPDGTLQLTDLGSTNGTLLNGEKVDPAQPVTVKAGDRIGLGPETEVSLEVGA